MPDAPDEDYEDLYQNAPCGYLSVQNDGRIFKVNATFCGWLGYAPDRLIGKRLHDLLNIAGRIFYETHFAPLLRMQGFFNEVALDFVTAQGERLPVLVNAVERRGADASVLFTRLTVFNASDRRRYERELVEARAAAEDAKRQVESLNDDLETRIRQAVAERLHAEEELTQSKTLEALAQERLRTEVAFSELREQFIAVLGHDLRNPLAAISSASTLLLRQPQSERSTAIIGMMRSSVLRMSTLIDNVLDFARARMGLGFSVTKSAEDSLEETLEEILDEFRSIAPEHRFEASFSIGKPVSFDKSRIAQLVSNLLGNALTYGAADQPIRLGASTDGQALELWVANAGEEISASARERLFQPFFRGEVRRSQQGLGLGLYIASEIARAHGGSLAVSSNAQETRFTFQMPL